MKFYHNFNSTYFLISYVIGRWKTQLEPKFLEAKLLIELIFNHKQNDYLDTLLSDPSIQQ